MSPEQANGSGLVDARADIYSLGVTLYELLTLAYAHPGDDRAALLRQIANEEPIAPRKINPAVPIDLETIVLGAMAKGRDERYASAQALADDLERFLDGKPTLARRPTLVDRAGKWARRHRPLVAVAACSLALVSIVSVAGMVLLAREQSRTRAALADSQRSAAEAKESLDEARRVVDQFGMRVSDRLGEIPGAEALRRDLLLDTLTYYRQLTMRAGDDPQLQHETALAHFKSGVIAGKLGAVDDAIKEYETAKKSLAKLVAADPTRTEPRGQLAVAHNNLALLLAARGDADRARQEYDAAIALQQKLVQDGAGDASFADQLAESQANLGVFLDQQGDTSGAEQALRSAVNVLGPLAESPSAPPKLARNFAIACNNLSFVLRKRDLETADRISQQAVEILERLANEPKAGGEYQDDLALCYNNRAALKSQNEKWNEAIDWHVRAIKLQEQMARKSPAVVRHRSDLAISLNNLGVAYCRAGMPPEADVAFGRARELFATLADDYPDQLAYRSSLAALLNNQALALAGIGRHAEALRTYPAAIEAQQSCRERAGDSEMMREMLSKMYYNYGQSLRAEGRMDEAAETALARRDLWNGNGERLLRVAAELAELAAIPSTNNGENGPAQRLEDAVFATLQQAYDSGWPRDINVADERFASLAKNQRFADRFAELNDLSLKAAQSKTTSEKTQSTN
jgi:tetratricopeptide (TPR) repeat protein